MPASWGTLRISAVLCILTYETKLLVPFGCYKNTSFLGYCEKECFGLYISLWNEPILLFDAFKMPASWGTVRRSIFWKFLSVSSFVRYSTYPEHSVVSRAHVFVVASVNGLIWLWLETLMPRPWDVHMSAPCLDNLDCSWMLWWSTVLCGTVAVKTRF